MKKIILGTTLISSLLLSNDQWKNELDIHGGILNNNLSKETSKYFCEHTNKDSLANEILEHFKKQDLGFYNSHKSSIDVLPMQLIKSTEKSNLSCPSGFIATGSCGDWKCSQQPTQDEMTKYINGHCFDLEKEKNENDTTYGERVKSCLTVQYLKTTKDIFEKKQKMLRPETTSGVEK